MPFNGDAANADSRRKMLRVMNQLFRVLDSGLRKAEALAVSVAQKHLSEKQKKKMLEAYGVTKEFQKYVKSGGKLKAINVHKNDYLDLVKELKARNVPFISSEIVGDDCYCIRFRADDEERVQMAVQSFTKKRTGRTEMAFDEFSQKYSGQGILSIHGIDPVEFELIRYYADKYRIDFSVDSKKENDYRILFHDKKGMDKILHDVGWQVSGEQGPRVREQIEYHLAGRANAQRIMKREDLEKEYYIVSQANPKNFMHITADEVEMYMNDNATALTGDEQEIYQRELKAIQGMEKPVILTEDEWNQPNRAAIIAAKQEVIPTGPFAVDDHMLQEVKQKERDARLLYDAKLSLDNSFSLKYNNSMTDPTVGFEQFFDVECTNDDHEEELAHAVAAATYLYNKHLEIKEERGIEATEHEKEEFLRRETERAVEQNLDAAAYGLDSRYSN